MNFSLLQYNKALNESSAMSQHKSSREKDSKPTSKKSSNGVVTKQGSGEHKNIDVKYTKRPEDGNSKKKPSTTTHQESMADPTVDVLAGFR